MRTSALHGVHVISICEGFVSRTAVNLAVSGIRPRVNPTCRGKEEGLGGGERERERKECGGSDKARTPVRNQQREQERGKGGGNNGGAALQQSVNAINGPRTGQDSNGV